VSTISPFCGSIPRKIKTSPSCPDFAGPLSIWGGTYNCAIWLNQTKKARPYLAVRLSKQGLGLTNILKLALWERPPPGHFEATLQTPEGKFVLRALIKEEPRSLKLSLEPAGCFNSASLGKAKERLPIPVLWQVLALPGTVRSQCCVRSPLRNDDRVPSFSIFANGRRFRDHGTGTGGDSFDFFKLITKLDSGTAYRRFLELAAIPPET
jgi:hypothetical protein